MTVQHPAKVDALVDASGEADDFLIAAKALADGENAGKQECRVDRRDFAVPAPLSCFRVHPMIKPAALMKSTRVKEAQSIASAFECFGFGDPATIGGDAE